MCVGLKVEDILPGEQLPIDSKFTSPNHKRINSDVRKEKAKDAARARRTQESDYFEELERLLPVSEPPPTSQQTTLDKTSVIRLSVAHLKIRDVLQNGLKMPDIKEEVPTEIDLFECLDGFSLALGSNGDVIFVSENVTKYIGLTQVELLGQDFSDYIHPCDHQELKKLTPKKKIGIEDELVEIFVRVKCTVTERGRMINLKQANYKPMKITGKCRCIMENDDGGVKVNFFLGIARSVVEREVMVDQQIGVFATKHSVDMRFMATDPWMSTVANYSSHNLLGVSFFELVHAQDLINVQTAFKNLKDHGQCETPPYRLLCYGGGFTWVQTKACLAATRKGSSKEQSVSCSHQQISEVMNKEEILSLIQMKAETSHPSSPTKMTNSALPMKNDILIVKDEEHSIIKEPYMIQFDILKENLSPKINNTNSEKSIRRPITIEPRETPHTKENITYDSGMDKKVSSTPTSVIVRCQKPEVEVKSMPIFENGVKKLNDNKGKIINTATNDLWFNSYTLTMETEPIFNISEPDIQTWPVTQEEIFEPVWISGIPEEEKVVAVKENEFFEEIFTGIQGLAKLSPYSGEQIINLGKMNEREDPVFESVNFDDLICLDFSDTCAEFSFNDKLDMPNKEGGMAFKSVFNEEQILIDPERKTMWGSKSINEKNDISEILRPCNQMSGNVNWSEEDLNNTNNLNLMNSIVVPNSFGAKHPGYFSDQNEDDQYIEPPGDKILCRRKNGTTVPKKRILSSDVFDKDYFVKKKRMDLENNYKHSLIYTTSLLTRGETQL